MAFVSIIVPAYNPGPYLKVALGSLLAQGFKDWEGIVVDDGSTEDLTWVAAVDKRIILLKQTNLGLSLARNAAIERTSGPLVAFLDSDDIWSRRKLSVQVATLADRPSAALVSTGFEIINECGEVTGGGFEGYNSSYEGLLQGCGIGVSTVVVRRAVLEEVGLFDRNLRCAQDWDLWLRIAKDHPLVVVDEVLAQYRVHSRSMSRDWRQNRAEARAVLQRHCHPLVAAGLARAEELACHQAFDAARASFKQRRLFDVARDIAFVGRHKPGLLAAALKLRGHGSS